MALIIFDYDGVLADTMDDLILFGQQACDSLGVKHHVTKENITTLEVMSFATYGKACEVPEPSVDKFVNICLGLFAEKKIPPAMFSGLSEVIRQLSLRNKLAVVSTNSTQNIHAFLANHGLNGYIHAVYGIDSPGSKAEKISLARNQLLTDPSQESTYMVGDSLSDILAAKEASVTSIAVSWGHQDLDILLRGSPNYVVSSPQDLFEVVGYEEH